MQLCLLHKKLQFQCHLLSFSDRDNRRDWFLALNPRGQVPLLLHDGVPVTQSLAILLYVEDKFPSTPLLPSDSVEKARVIAHVCEMDDKLHRDVEHDIFHRGLKKEIDESVRKELNEKVDKELGVWETYLEKVGTDWWIVWWELTRYRWVVG